MKSAKAALRKQALEIRDAIPEMSRIEMSLAAGFNLNTLSPLQTPDVVAGFWPIRSEIDLRPALADVRDRGGRLCLPVVLDRETIVFREMLPGAKMIETGFGTIGPDEKAKIINPTLILVPLAGFDRSGGRLGYGGGYYDRAIEKLHNRSLHPLLVGMAFSAQEVDKVPMEPHDQPLDFIVTDREIITVAAAGKENT